MIEFYKRNKENIDKIFYFFLFLFFLHLFFKYIAPYIAPFIFGYIFSLILFPFVKFLQNKLKFSRFLSVVLSLFVFFVFLIYAGTFLFNKVYMEVTDLIKDMPYYEELIKESVIKVNETINAFKELAPETLRQEATLLISNFISGTFSFLGEQVRDLTFNLAKKLPSFVLTFVLAIVCSFFILKDKENIDRFIYNQIPSSIKKRLLIFKNSAIYGIMGYIKAQLIIMSMIFVICLIGLNILNIHYSWFIALIIAIIDALPIFGSGFVLWPWSIFSYVNGNYKLALGLAIIYCVVLLFRNLIEPRILGKQIGIPPLAALLSIFVGLKLFGVIGIIVGPIVLIIIKSMQDSSLLPKWK